MADSNSQPPRCPCGFWGSAQTLGLCSKCYKDQQKKNSEPTSVVASQEPSGAPSSILPSTSLSAPTSNSVTPLASSEQASSSGAEPDISQNHDTTTNEGQNTDNGVANGNSKQGEPSKDPTPGIKRDPEVAELDPDRPPQKNRKRCYKCNIKLELAIREIGRCRCDYVFCQLHRLPEQHDCIFDHKESGRKEARDKMVSPKKHVGTSLRRLDSDS